MDAPKVTDQSEEAALDLHLAQLIERWQARRTSGETPDLLELAAGDAALAERLREYTDVVQAIDDTGFAALSEQPIAGALVQADLPSVPDFVVLKELGRGGMGIVRTCRAPWKWCCSSASKSRLATATPRRPTY